MFRRKLYYRHKPPAAVKLGDWRRLFSIKPSFLCLHNTPPNIVTNIVTGETVTYVGYSENRGSFGQEIDTNNANQVFGVQFEDGIDSGQAVSGFIFCRYNDETIQNRFMVFPDITPLIYGVPDGSGLKASIFAGTVISGTPGGLNRGAPSYKNTGYHCWGGIIKSNDATSSVIVDGKIQATGNPGTYTPNQTVEIYHSRQTGGNDMDANVVWSVLFNGALPEDEAIRITQSPELIYSILEPVENAPILSEALTGLGVIGMDAYLQAYPASQRVDAKKGLKRYDARRKVVY